MCEWYYKNGRCGDAFPTSSRQYMFIGEDVVTPDIMIAKKAECNARSSSSSVSLFSLSPLLSMAKMPSHTEHNDYDCTDFDNYEDYYDCLDNAYN